MYKGFSGYDLFDAAFHEYEASILAARAANLLSALRKLGRVSGKTLATIGKLSKLRPREMSSLLSHLDELGAMNVAKVKDRIEYVKTTGSSAKWVLETAGVLFDHLGPTDQEQASLIALDLTVVIPLPETTLHGRISEETEFSDETVTTAVEHLVQCKLLQRTRETDEGCPVISNPYSFRGLGRSSERIVSQLIGAPAEPALEIIEHVRSRPGVPLPPDVDQDALALLVNAGIIDQSAIRVSGSRVSREFPTIPHLWGTFQLETGASELDEDLVDDAKLFLNSIRYGEFYSPASRGRIQDPAVLVDRLLKRGEVGPATAIGTDYPLPLSRGIVAVQESRVYPGRFHMQLRKEDVAHSVLQILEQGTVLENPTSAEDGLLGTSGAEYQAPETIRATRDLPSRLRETADQLAFELRSYRSRK